MSKSIGDILRDTIVKKLDLTIGKDLKMSKLESKYKARINKLYFKSYTKSDFELSVVIMVSHNTNGLNIDLHTFHPFGDTYTMYTLGFMDEIPYKDITEKITIQLAN